MTAVAKLPEISTFIEQMDMLRDDFVKYQDGNKSVPFVVLRDALVAALNAYDDARAALSPAELGGVEIVPGRIVGYLMRAQAVEFVTDGPLPEWLASQPNLRAVIATGETFKAIGREGEGHSAEWCAGWNAHLIASTPRAAEAVTVDKAMIERAVNACIQSKGRYSAYHAPETDDEWRAALTASLTPPSAKGE